MNIHKQRCLGKFLGTFNRTDQEDPLKNFRFIIEIENFARAGFSKCSGLKANTSVAKYREGGMNATTQKSPAQTEFPDITLERGMVINAGAGGFDMYTWYQQVFDISSKTAASSAIFRRTIEIVMFNKPGVETLRWRVIESWAMGLDPVPELDGQGEVNAIEKLVVVHEGFKLVTSI